MDSRAEDAQKPVKPLPALVEEARLRATPFFSGTPHGEMVGEELLADVTLRVASALESAIAETARLRALSGAVPTISEEQKAALIERVLHAESPDCGSSFSCDCWERTDGLLVVRPGGCPRHPVSHETIGMTKCGVCGDLHISEKERAALAATLPVAGVPPEQGGGEVG